MTTTSAKDHDAPGAIHSTPAVHPPKQSEGRLKIVVWLLIPALSLALAGQTYGDTFVSGSIATTTWTTNGSPYRVIGNCNVDCGQVLTIQPGVTVIFAEGLEMAVGGQIIALGSPAQRITFRGQNASTYWNRIYVNYGPGCGADSRFEYCNFSEATVGVQSFMASWNLTTAIQFSNCAFTNCVQCIYGYVDDYWSRGSILRHVIKNCTFRDSTNGITIITEYTGRASPTIANNVFQGIAGTAVRLSFGGRGGYGTCTPQIINNVFKTCASSLVTGDPFNCSIENNIFSDSTTAVQRSGSLSLNAAYNCFFNNGTNFLGYPAGVHGTICGGCVNRNGTPCDSLYNIFVDPQFCEMTNCTLSASSPCIDAGDPAAAFLDVCPAAATCSPGSMGSNINDIGAYGGPQACNWIPCAAPTIISQPQGQSSCLGQSATFCVTASGTPPLGYQWWFKGSPLSGQTSNCLVLGNLQASNAGPYSVVVSNSCGSVTSVVAQLVINDACVDICMYAGLNISGLPGRTYELRYTTDLNNTNFSTWTFLATNMTPWFYIDTNSCGSLKRFYGVKMLP
jgi:hypothetical protein